MINSESTSTKMKQNKKSLKEILKLLRKEIKTVKAKSDLVALRTKYLGRKSRLNIILKSIAKFPERDRPIIGKIANQTKTQILSLINKKAAELEKPVEKEKLDITLPGRPYYIGNLHPINRIYRELNAIMRQMGFSVYDGPHIESDFNNFEALNLPKNHPARDLWDTVYIKSPEILLRCHTSPVEVRAMKNEKLPLRIVCPGLCFRNEKPNANNHFYFHQYEALAIGEGITMAHLKGMTEFLFKEIVGEDVVIRFRQKHYPQVEPGVGIDILCRFCKGRGCPLCKHRKWVEIAGAGMVHVNTLKMCGIDPEKYTGFAWGIGADRLAMQKFGIKDIRHFFSGELVYT